MRHCAAIAVVSLAACGTPSSHTPTDGATGSGGSDATTDPSGDAPRLDATPHDDARALDAPSHPDAFPAVLDVGINCHNDCTLVATPPSISVTAGTGFEVDWHNTGDTPCDVAKIDQFNQVPIVLDLEPGDSYLDSVRTWCGTQFTGTFEFRIDICTIPSYIPVDCGQ